MKDSSSAEVHPAIHEDSEGDSRVAVERNIEGLPYFSVKARRREAEPQEYRWPFLSSEYPEDAEVDTERIFRVLPNARYGPPGPVDQDVYLAVVQLLDSRGGMPPTGVLPFTLYEVIAILGWPDCGTSYKALKDSLKRMASTVIESEHAFYAAGAGVEVSDTFTLFSAHFREAYTLFGERREGHRLVFHPYFVENYLEGYLRTLDSSLYWRLSSPLSRRLYRLVESDRQRAGERAMVLKYGLGELASRLPLPESARRYPSKIKQTLRPAHQELLGSGYLAAADLLKAESAVGQEYVRYRLSREYAERSSRGDPFGGLSGEARRAAGALASSGVSAGASRSLVLQYGSPRCRSAVDILAKAQQAEPPATSGNNNARAIKNPGGWVRSLIEGATDLGERASGDASRLF